MDDIIAEYMAKGLTRQAAERMAGITPTTQEKATPQAYDKDTMRKLANTALQQLLSDMTNDPSSYKPNEIIAAAREALDRTEGKAAQSLSIDTKQTVTHEHVMKLPPAEAYRLIMESKVIDVTPGGDTVEQAAGGVSCETPSSTTPENGV